jgi:glyoxylase-like metal-dependent hydrolase (beta-lactamase superfamily II)
LALNTVSVVAADVSPLLDSFRSRLDYDKKAYVKSLQRLLDDPPDVLYPGHGPFCLSDAHVWIEEELKKLLAQE